MLQAVKSFFRTTNKILNMCEEIAQCAVGTGEESTVLSLVAKVGCTCLF